MTPTPAPTPTCGSPNTLVTNATGATGDEKLTLGIAGSSTLAGPSFTSSGNVYGVCLSGHSGCSNNLPATYSLWNLIPELFGLSDGASPSGTAYLTYTGSGTITTTVNLSGVIASGVIGYPNIQAGIAGGGDSAEGQPPQFAVQLNSVNSIVLGDSYSLNILDTNANHDKLLDEWVQPTAALADPDQLEVAIFWYYDFNQSPLSTTYIGTFTEPMVVNGTLENIQW